MDETKINLDIETQTFRFTSSKPINQETRENLVKFFMQDVSKLEQLLQIN